MNRHRRLAFQSAAITTILLAGAWTCAAQDVTTPEAPAALPASTSATSASGTSASGTSASGASTPAAADGTQPVTADGTAAADGTQTATAVDATSKEDTDGFRMGGFVFKPSGRVKLDVIRDFKPIGSEDSFDTRTIPVDDSEGTNSNIHAKETRLNLDIRGQAEGRELRMFIETDFYGTSSALRLRHAYGSYGGLMAGQTWTTFMDEDNLPRTIDFEAPTAFAQVRQAQARWTQKFDHGITWAAAVEDNKSAIVIPGVVPGKAEYPFPDVVSRVRFDIPRGHIMASGFVGAARFRPTEGEGDPDSVTLWGTMGSAKFAPFGKDSVFVKDSVFGVFTVGDGIGRYRGGTTAIPDDTGELHAIGGVAFMGGYEHFWTSRWSTNGVYSVADTSDEAFYTSAINKQLTYGAVNLLYWFLGDRAWTGVEYIYGDRKVFGDQEESTGSAHRLQYAVRFNLP